MTPQRHTVQYLPLLLRLLDECGIHYLLKELRSGKIPGLQLPQKLLQGEVLVVDQLLQQFGPCRKIISSKSTMGQNDKHAKGLSLLKYKRSYCTSDVPHGDGVLLLPRWLLLPGTSHRYHPQERRFSLPEATKPFILVWGWQTPLQ